MSSRLPYLMTSSMTSSNKNLKKIFSGRFLVECNQPEVNTMSRSPVIKTAKYDYAFFAPNFGLFWAKLQCFITVNTAVHPIIGQVSLILP